MMRQDRELAFFGAGIASAIAAPDSSENLSIVLVPETSILSSVRDAITPSMWESLRARVYARAGHCCEACGTCAPRRADELWEFDDESHVQRLVRMVALCSDCHEARRMDRFGQMRAGRGALEHLARVNRWTVQQAERYRATTFRRWRERSRAWWSVDLGALRDYGITPELIL
jgi:hypothetical protein